MGTSLVINCNPHEIRIGLIEDGQVVELMIERRKDSGVLGNIYKGRVSRVLPGMQAAFVDIGLERAAFSTWPMSPMRVVRPICPIRCRRREGIFIIPRSSSY